MSKELSEEYKLGNNEAHTLWLRHICSGMIRLAYIYQALKEENLIDEIVGAGESLTTIEIGYESYAALLESMVSQHGFTVPDLDGLPTDRDLGPSDILRAPEESPNNANTFFIDFGNISMN